MASRRSRLAVLRRRVLRAIGRGGAAVVLVVRDGEAKPLAGAFGVIVPTCPAGRVTTVPSSRRTRTSPSSPAASSSPQMMSSDVAVTFGPRRAGSRRPPDDRQPDEADDERDQEERDRGADPFRCVATLSGGVGGPRRPLRGLANAFEVGQTNGGDRRVHVRRWRWQLPRHWNPGVPRNRPDARDLRFRLRRAVQPLLRRNSISRLRPC